MKISANMATMPERTDSAIKVIESIYDQVSYIRLYLNNFETIPEKFKEEKISIHQGVDLKSSGKVFWATNPDEYYFCIDDDILYPSDYIKYSIQKLNEYNDDVIISYHGRKFEKHKKIKNYFKDYKKYYHFKDENIRDREVEVIGNGVSCWNTNNIIIDVNKFKYYYMDDILVSSQAAEQNKKRIVVAHQENYLTPIKTSGNTLYKQYHKNHKTQTEVYNSINWWVK